MIAITFALPAESAGVVDVLRDRRNDCAIVYGKLIAREVAIFHTGVGQAAAEPAIERFLDAVRPTILVSAGFAGGIDDQLVPGDRIVAENYSDPALVRLVSDRFDSTRIRLGRLFTAASVIDSPAERTQIARENGAFAVDMETSFIARACQQRGVRMLSLRAITDTLKKPFPIPPAVLFDISRQKTKPAALLWHLTTRPASIPRLIRFARQVEIARNELAADIYSLVDMMVDRDNEPAMFSD